MRRTWVAVLVSGIVLLAALGMICFSTVGSVYLTDWLKSAAEQTDSAGRERLYALALRLNPYDSESRIALSDCYFRDEKEKQGEMLLWEGIRSYAKGPELFLSLAQYYSGKGRPEQACSVLDSAPSGYLSRRLKNLRPETPRVSASGAIRPDTELKLSGENCWYSLDESAWKPYTTPLLLPEGKHTLCALSLDQDGIPSRKVAYEYSVEQARQASVHPHLYRCPHCGEIFHVYLYE